MLHTFTMFLQTPLKFKSQHGKLYFYLLQIHTVALFPRGTEMNLDTICLHWLSSFFLFLSLPSFALIFPIHFISLYSRSVGEKPICCHWGIDQSH